MSEETKSKDYMGMISWHRTSCGSPQNLFGTEVKTDHPITVRISHAEETRDLCKDWFFPRKEIIEVDLSPIQWAELLTGGNTSGVPCTIRRINGEIMSKPDATEIKEHYNKEINEHFDAFDDAFKKVADVLKTQIDSNKPMTKKSLESLLREVEALRTGTVANVNFVKDSFKEDMERIVTKGKAEFNAYVENRLIEIGTDAIKSGSVQLLEGKSEDHE